MTADSTCLTVRDLRVEYRVARRVVVGVEGVGLDVAAGRLTVLAGPSGSGKSSVLRVLGLLEAPTAGRVVLDGREVTGLGDRRRRALRRRCVAYVHQRPVANLVDGLRPREQVALAAVLAGRSADGAERWLDRVGLAGRADARPGHLSGGEQQRLAFAMAAARQPRLMVADEPTAELDRDHAHAAIGAVLALVEAGATAVMASHDPDLIAAAHHVVWLRDGRRVDG